MPNYTIETVFTAAAYPRGPGSTTLATDRLQVAYDRYTPVEAVSGNKIKLNLVFVHGTGMNKGVWKYHIERLFEIYRNNASVGINRVLCVDSSNHGDLALANGDKIGWCPHWDDGGRDLVAIAKNEQFNGTPTERTIVIGHSMGGFQAIVAGLYEPALFDSIIAVEPVFYMRKEYLEFAASTFGKVARYLKDEFDSEEDFNTFFRKKSFYRAFPDKVLQPLIESEKWTHVDASGKKTWRVKTDANKQLVSYYTAMVSIPVGMAALKSLSVPLTHVVGSDATWNPPEIAEYFKEEQPDLVETVIVEGGLHLLHGEKPDETVDIIKAHIDKRVTNAQRIKGSAPEIKHHGDRKAILKEYTEYMLKADYDSALGFASQSRPKL